ncbi:MAG TPA: nitroreductase family protein [Streptosporangiaceae bacterium]|nr:nitroreductase family protein [Streptosporangiaceae bacterium]
MTRITRFPRLCRGLVIVPDGDAVLVDGGPRRRRLTGKGVSTLLPRVLPLLDGTRGSRSIARTADLDHAVVERMLTVLDESGLLEWPGPPAAAAPRSADHVTAYFSRTIGAIAGPSCTEELIAALGSAAVLLVADDPVAAQVAADLTETGVGEVLIRNVSRQACAADIERIGRSPRPFVAVLDDSSQNLASAVQLTRGCGIAVLRFAGDAYITEIGPVFYDGWAPCVGCFRSGYAGSGAGVSAARRPSDLVAALATTEILAALAQVTTPSRPCRMRRTSSRTWRTEWFDMVPGTGCQACGHGAPPAHTSAEGALALAYEWQHEIPPAALRVSALRTREQQRRITALPHERDPFPPVPSRDLADGLTGSALLLAGLLARTAGLRTPLASGRPVDRWAPSGGNLGSVQLYVATEHDLFGLPGTLFRYDDLGHRILPVRADRIPLPTLLAGTGRGAGAFDVVVIFVASVRRIGRKYDEFAARLAHLDAGCAALQLSVAGSAAGITTSFAAAWSPDVAELLELEPDDGEMVTAIAVLHGNWPEGTAACH